MSDKVFLHVGLPKTATTYLQTILWANRDVLAAQGLGLPGDDRRDHLWSSRIVREESGFLTTSSRRRVRAWDRVRRDIEAWSGTSLVSHEFFAAASGEQARRVVEQLAPAEVHLVLTGREPLGLFTASWQESIKNRDTTPMADYSREESSSSTAIWNWRTLDIRLVLERWAPAFPPERVHILPLPGKDAPRRLIWDRFAELLDVDPDSVDLTTAFANTSMGVVETETLRRMNHHLGEFQSAIDKGTFIRTFVADERLVPRGGDRFWPAPDRVEECRERGRRAVEHIRAQHFDVLGDAADLLVPDELPARRTPESVTDSEVAGVAVELAATLLHDVRDLRHERRRLRRELARARARPDLAVAARQQVAGARRRLTRLGRRLRGR